MPLWRSLLLLYTKLFSNKLMGFPLYETMSGSVTLGITCEAVNAHSTGAHSLHVHLWWLNDSWSVLFSTLRCLVFYPGVDMSVFFFFFVNSRVHGIFRRHRRWKSFINLDFVLKDWSLSNRHATDQIWLKASFSFRGELHFAHSKDILSLYILA